MHNDQACDDCAGGYSVVVGAPPYVLLIGETAVKQPCFVQLRAVLFSDGAAVARPPVHGVFGHARLPPLKRDRFTTVSVPQSTLLS